MCSCCWKNLRNIFGLALNGHFRLRGSFLFLVKLKVWNGRLFSLRGCRYEFKIISTSREIWRVWGLPQPTFLTLRDFLSEKKESFLLRVLGKMNLMKNIILGPWMSREIPHSMTICFILGLFIKSSVTSDYNEPSVSVTHVLRMISYLSVLCVLWPPWLWGAWGSCTVSRSTVEALQKY